MASNSVWLIFLASMIIVQISTNATVKPKAAAQKPQPANCTIVDAKILCKFDNSSSNKLIPICEETNITSLNIQANSRNLSSIIDTGTFAQCKMLQNLSISNNTKLVIHSNKEKKITMPFCGLKRLKSLNLSHNGIEVLPWQELQSDGRPSLDIHGNQFRCNCGFSWIENYQQLQQVRIISAASQYNYPCEGGTMLTISAYSTAAFYGLPREIVKLNDLIKSVCQETFKPVPAAVTASQNCPLPVLQITPELGIVNQTETITFQCGLNIPQNNQSARNSGSSSQAKNIVVSMRRYSMAGQFIEQAQASRKGKQYKISVKNVSNEDTGWIICTATSDAGPAVALGVLLVRAPPKIQYARHDNVINSSYTAYVDFAIQSYVRPCVQVLKGSYALPLRKEKDLEAREHDPITEIQWGSHPSEIVAPKQFCSTFQNLDTLSKRVSSALFIHSGSIVFHSVGARTDIHDNFTMVVCNEAGCDEIQFKVNMNDYPDASIANPKEHQKLEGGINVGGIIAIIAAAILLTIVFITIPAAYASYRRSAAVIRRKSYLTTATTEENDHYQGLFQGHRGSTNSTTAPLIPLHALGPDGSTPWCRQTRSASLVTYLTTAWNSRRSSQTMPLFIDEAAIKWDRKIGEGYFSEVYLAYCAKLPGVASESEDQFLPLAVKVVKDQSCHTAQAIYQEAELNRQLKHPNIIRFHGLAIRPNGRYGSQLCLAFEYMPNGDLKNYLRKHGPLAHLVVDDTEGFKLDSASTVETEEPPKQKTKPPHLTLAEQVKICCQTAAGVSYLEQKKFIHRDIAARNCLVGTELLVKISDFGMSKDVYDNEYYKTEGRKLLPVRWLPPESFQLGTFNSKTDIWSFGVLMWEIFAAGGQPWPKLSNCEVIDAVLAGQVLDKPESCPDKIYNLMKRCWLPESGSRITAVEMEKSLKEFQESINSQPDVPCCPCPDLAYDTINLMLEQVKAAEDSPILPDEPCVQESCCD